MGNEYHLFAQTVLDKNWITLFDHDECIETIQNEADFQSDNTYVRDIHRCLSSHSVKPESVHSIHILQGPGYFTGIRAGIVIAKAWIDVYSTPVRITNTFDYIKEQILNSNNIAIVIKASRLDGYAGYYKEDLLYKQECIKLNNIPDQYSDWDWFTPSEDLKEKSNIHYLIPSIHLPKKYKVVTKSEHVVPLYGRSLEELFNPL